jgi:Fe2+ transport system protein FeoA
LEADQTIHDWVPLTRLTVGMGGEIANIETVPAVQMYLTEQGLRSGAEVTIEAIGVHGSRLVEVEGDYVELSEDISKAVWLVQPNQTSPKVNSG